MILIPIARAIHARRKGGHFKLFIQAECLLKLHHER